MASVPLIVPETVQVTLKGAVGGRPVESVFYVWANRPIGFGNSQTVAEKVRTAWQRRIMPSMSSAYILSGAHYVDLNSLTGDSGDVGVDGAYSSAGGQGSGASPNVSFLCKWNGDSVPRGHSFRSYFGPPSDADIDTAGNIDGTRLATLQTGVNNFVDDLSDDTEDAQFHISVVTFPRTKILEPGKTIWQVNGDGTQYQTLSGVVSGKAATQRRRLRG